MTFLQTNLGNNWTFIAGFSSGGKVPVALLPEVAFAGRSNVGKSSLLNALTGLKRLARVSKTPGRTREINFFQCPDVLCLVDLPGYGYAKISKSLRSQWKELVEGYLAQRTVLQRVCLLVDSRHGLKESDRLFCVFLESIRVPYQIILTKCDKISAPQRDKLREGLMDFLQSSPLGLSEIVATSAQTQEGLDILRLSLLQMASPQKIN